MSNKVLTYAIGGSLAVHLLVFCVIGHTSSARPVDLDDLKLVKVDLESLPSEAEKVDPVQPEPEPEPEPTVQPDDPDPVPFVPPIKQMNTIRAPKPQPIRTPTSARPAPGPHRVASSGAAGRPAGNPGGALDLGSTSSRGQNLGNTGGTSRVGYVPNPRGGRGTGSGTGAGVGTPDPPRHADDGSGTSPAPAPPPPPRTVEVNVCSVSGLRPNRHCDRKVTRSYREGHEPSGTCGECKAPEPVHVNRLADWSEPELIHDPKVRVPSSVAEDGISVKIKIQYTVEADGSVGDVKITQSSGERSLDKAVLDSARKMKYKPAIQNGVPRAVKKTRTYPFNL